MKQITQPENKIIFTDLFGNELKKVICKDCKEDVTTLPHHKESYCFSCAVKKGLIKFRK